MVSCIVPVFNADAWVRTCIESILADPETEAVAVDDGSEDRSLAILESIREGNPGRLTVLSQRNKGPAAARNLGAAAAHGKWLWFVDADDFLVPEALPAVREALSRTECDALAVGMGEFRCFPSSVPPLPEKVLVRPSDPATALFAFSSGAPRTIVRKSLWLAAMPENAVAENVWAEDNLSFARIMLKAQNVWQLLARVYARRRHAGSRSGLQVHMSSFAAKTAPRLLDNMAALRASAPPALAEALEWRIARVAEYVNSVASMTLAAECAPSPWLEEVAAAKAAARIALSSVPEFENRGTLSETVSAWLEKTSVQTATEKKIARFRLLRAMRRIRDAALESSACFTAIPARLHSRRTVFVELSAQPFTHSPESIAQIAKAELAIARRNARILRVK